MILTAVCYAIGQILVVLFVCLWLRHFVNAKQAELERKAEDCLRAWVEQPDPKKPSKLAELVASMGTVVGQSAAHSIMQSIYADKSHATRLANGASEELEAQSNPLAALFGGGARGKGAGIMRLAQLLGPMLLKGQPEEGNGHSKSVRERLQKGG